MTAEQRVAALWERLDDISDEDFRRLGSSALAD
jgi:hypothetical protein